MKQFFLQPALLVFVGGGLGSVLRYGLGIWMPMQPGERTFPIAILGANVLASLVLGVVAGAVANRLMSQDLRLLLGVGFCGGLSTFSTFSVDTLVLLQQGRAGAALLNVGLNIAGCLLASAAGFWIVTANQSSI
ncbi:MAG: fluoride efflux transporter CrcB [Cytophagales bacterium]|nr:MAG: fluoride efflux transporter CrcB [Cytophagales bacterium]